MESLGNLSKHQRRIISAQLEKEKSKKNVTNSVNYLSDKAEFEANLNKAAFSYYNFKLSNVGLVSYKGFENCSRKVSVKSLNNLLHYNPWDMSGESYNKPFDSCLGFIASEREIKRQLTLKQSKEVRRFCNKLAFYSGTRQFFSKKSGSYSFKVAFLTLTAPECTTTVQFLKAFDLFLDYLRRTANCVYVWKKEYGSKSGQLHVHLMINNFIPYYIVDWKWKRLLISQGVSWPKNDKNVDTSSHYRIEIPKNAKCAGAYISKYMSKIDYCPENIGYLWGKSKILTECKELVFIESELPLNELSSIYSKFKTIGSEWVKICLVNFLKVESIAPDIYNLFMHQFFDFQNKLTLPQRFQFV